MVKAYYIEIYSIALSGRTESKVFEVSTRDLSRITADVHHTLFYR